MPYMYEKQKRYVFTDEGHRTFLKVRDAAVRLYALAGAVSCGKLMHAAGSGDTWDQLACIDRLVELGELRRVTPVGSCSTLDEVFVRTGA
jgi:hypothetical protein